MLPKTESTVFFPGNVLQCLNFDEQYFRRIETSQLIFRANQLAVFYTMKTLVVKGQRQSL